MPLVRVLDPHRRYHHADFTGEPLVGQPLAYAPNECRAAIVRFSEDVNLFDAVQML